MRKLYTLFILIVINANLQAQSLRKPVAASYIGLGAYSINHADAFSFTSNQAVLAQIKSPTIGVYGENRFILNATNIYSGVAVMPTRQGNSGIQIDYFGFKDYNESQIRLAYA